MPRGDGPGGAGWPGAPAVTHSQSPRALKAPDGGAFAHQALLYRSVDELADIAAPFLREGVHAGDATLMVSAPDKLAVVRDVLDPDEARHVVFKRNDDEYADVGPALAGFQQLFEEHTAGGRRVRFVAEPPLASASPPHRRELCHNDAAANAVAAWPGVTAVCTVEVPATPAPALAAMRRCHPEVVEAGTCQPSPEYTDPATLLAEERRKPLPSPPARAQALAGPADAATARAFLDEELTGVLGPDRRRDFVTAVNEIVINAFTHAVIDCLRLWHEDERVVCEVSDGGQGLSDPLAGYRQPDVWQTSGWGLWLARQMAHVVEVSTSTGGSTVRLHAIASADHG